APAPGARYTTVTQWWNNHYAFLDGDTYDCNKRSGFLPLLPLPGRAGVSLEIAANLHVDETEDRGLLARHGWRLVDPETGGGSGPGVQSPFPGFAGGGGEREPAKTSLREGARRLGLRSHRVLPGERPSLRGRGDGRRGAPAAE